MNLSLVGLGPGSLALLTAQAREALMAADLVLCQTAKHPGYDALCALCKKVEPLDNAYEQAQDFGELDETIVARVLNAATQYERVVLALSGHGLKAQTVATVLRRRAAEEGMALSCFPGLGLEEVALAHCPVDASGGVTVQVGAVKPLSLRTDIANVVVDLDTRLRASEAKLALLQRYAYDQPVFLFHLDAQGHSVLALPLEEMDRQTHYDAQTALVIPPLTLLEQTHYSAADLMDICRQLRAPDGCPWDREQTHLSIRKNMMEECCEAMAAISEGDDEHLCDELGDVLLQIALHATIASEEGAFDFTDVATAICEKMIRRHPHIFGGEQAHTTEQVLANWERIKQGERNGAVDNPFRKLGEGMPALMRAQEIQKKLPDVPALAAALAAAQQSLAELILVENDEFLREKLAGSMLWQVCAVLRAVGVHAETALSDCCMDVVANA